MRSSIPSQDFVGNSMAQFKINFQALKRLSKSRTSWWYGEVLAGVGDFRFKQLFLPRYVKQLLKLMSVVRFPSKINISENSQFSLNYLDELEASEIKLKVTTVKNTEKPEKSQAQIVYTETAFTASHNESIASRLIRLENYQTIIITILSFILSKFKESLQYFYAESLGSLKLPNSNSSFLQLHPINQGRLSWSVRPDASVYIVSPLT